MCTYAGDQADEADPDASSDDEEEVTAPDQYNVTTLYLYCVFVF